MTKRKIEAWLLPPSDKGDISFLRRTSPGVPESEGVDIYDAADIPDEYRRRGEGQSFCLHMERVISRLVDLGQYRTGVNYRMALKSFRRFLMHREILLTEIDARLVGDYQTWLASKHLKPNTISFYMRILRATYNRAVEERLVEDAHPFSKAYTGIARTCKRAVSLAEIRKVMKLKLGRRKHLELARDVFLFLFYCRGMSFIDAAFLRQSNIREGFIVYRRHKTGQQLEIRINKQIGEILEKYCPSRGGDNKACFSADRYLLPILESAREPGEKSPPGASGASGDTSVTRTAYESALRRFNNSLKKIGLLADIEIPLTTYVSRHTWASVARQQGIEISVISGALGHESERTTQIYLASIPRDTIDAANDKILSLL